MNRLLLLFVLLSCSFGLRAGPFSDNKTSTGGNPVNITVIQANTFRCDSSSLLIRFTLEVPKAEVKSATINFDDGRGEIALDSFQLANADLTYYASYRTTGLKHIVFRLLKTDGQYVEEFRDYNFPDRAVKLTMQPRIIYTNRLQYLYTPSLNGDWVSYQWSDGSTSRSLLARGPGTYRLQATDACGRVSLDSVVIKPAYDPCMEFVILEWTANCDSTRLHLVLQSRCDPSYAAAFWRFSDHINEFGSHVWHTFENSQRLTDVVVTLVNNTNGDQIEYNGSIPISPLYFDYPKYDYRLNTAGTVLTGRPDFSASRIKPDTSKAFVYKWSTGDTLQNLTVTRPGVYTENVAFKDCPDQVIYTRTYNLLSGIIQPLITPADQTGLTFNFTIDSVASYYDTFRWNFGDNTTAIGRAVSHTYSNNYTYPVTLVATKGTVSDSVTTWLKAGDEGLGVDLGPDRTICPGKTLNLRGTFNHNGGNYRWNTGDTTWDLNVTAPGQYILTVTAYNRTGTDTINITPGCVLKAMFDYKRANNGQLSMEFMEIPTSGVNATSRRWDFGDTAVSLAVNPVHTYAAPGNYNVKFWVYDSITHQEDSATRSISIIPPIKTTLGKDTTIAAGQSLTLSASDAIGMWNGDAAYLWSTGDTTRLLTVNKAGFYTLTVQMYGYTSSDTIKVTLNPPPIEPNVSMIYSNNGSNPRRAFLQNTSTLPGIVRTTWYTGDGNSVVLEGTESSYVFYTYAQEGVYQVRMEVLTADNLIHTAFEQIRVWPAFNAGNDTSFTGSPILFKINEPFYSDSSAKVTWYPGGIDGQQFNVQLPGTYIVTASRFGSVSADSIIVKEGRPQPQAHFTFLRANDGAYTMNFTAMPDTLNAAYRWYFGDGNTATGKNVSHTYNQPGLYNVLLSVTDTLQRIDTLRRLVEIVPFVTVNLGPDTTVEQGTPVRLDGIAAIGGNRPDSIQFMWSTGDTSAAITVTAPGSYGLSVSQYGRVITDSIRIYNRFIPPLKAAFTYGRANDGQLTVNFTAMSTPRAVKYKWDFGDNSFSDSGRAVSHTYSHAASFRVVLTVSDSTNATDSASQTVMVETPIHISLGPDTTYYGNPLSLRINAPYYGDSTVTVNWTPGNISGQQITVNAPGMYYATATQYGYSSTDSIRVREGRPQPHADLSYTRTNDGAYTMNFTGIPATGMQNVQYSWDFGDGSAATGKNVSHTYSHPGFYNVLLVVTDSLDHRDSVWRLMEMVPFVTVNLGPDTTLNPGSSISLDAVAAIGGIRKDGVSFLWSTGDTTQIIKVILPGSYVLSVSQYGRITRDTIVISAAAQIQVAFRYTTASADGRTLHFYNNSLPGMYPITQSAWTFDSVTVVVMGAPDSTLPVPYRFPAYGAHTVKLAVQDNQGHLAALTQNIYLQPDTTTPAPPVVDSSAAVIGANESVPVVYTFPHEINPDNVFTVQLVQSNATPGGRSAGPEIINISSFPGTDPRVSVNVKLPESVPCGKNYRIRVLSSSPADTSTWSQGFEVLNPPAVPVLTQRGDSLESSEGYAYQWFRNNQPVNGATTRAIRAKVNGAYQVQVFSVGDCSTMSAPLSMVITGLSDVSLTISKLSVYPNPSAGAVYVEVEKVPEKPVFADVYNSKGAIVHTLLIKDKKTVLDLSAQPRGIYYIVPRGAGKQKAATVVIQ